VTSGADSFALFTAGKLADPVQSTLALGANGTFQTLGSGASSNAVTAQGPGSFCAPSCSGFVEGFLSGTGGSHMGLAYSIRSNAVPNQFIDGTAAFKAGAAIDPGTAPVQVATGAYTGQYTIHMAYATFDTHYNSTVTYDSSGVMTAWTRTNGSNTTVIEPGPAAESGSVHNAIGWSRWLDTNNFASNDPNLAKTGRHLVSGTLPTSVPGTGTVNYALIGQTKPTDRAGVLDPGTFSGTLAVDFATRKVGFDFDVAMGDRGWNMKTAGGSANPNNGGYTFHAANFGFFGNPQVTGTTAASCTVSCSGAVQGSLFGVGASHVGLGYTITDGTGVSALNISGVGAFGRP